MKDIVLMVIEEDGKGTAGTERIRWKRIGSKGNEANIAV